MVFEFLIVMPLLAILFFGGAEFGIMMIVFTAANEAVVDGAREGSLIFSSTLPFDDFDLDPTGNNDIVDAIAIKMNKSLAAVGIEIKQDGFNDNAQYANAFMLITRSGVLSNRGRSAIAGHCVPTGQPATANECVVSLCFPLVSGAPAGQPIPNLLSTFGVDFSTHYFNATSRSRMQ